MSIRHYNKYNGDFWVIFESLLTFHSCWRLPCDYVTLLVLAAAKLYWDKRCLCWHKAITFEAELQSFLPSFLFITQIFTFLMSAIKFFETSLAIHFYQTCFELWTFGQCSPFCYASTDLTIHCSFQCVLPVIVYIVMLSHTSQGHILVYGFQDMDLCLKCLTFMNKNHC